MVKKDNNEITPGGAIISIIFVIVIGYCWLSFTGRLDMNNYDHTGQFKKKQNVIEETYESGDNIHVGYMMYGIWRSWWSTKLNSDDSSDYAPDAMFLLINLSVLNNDSKPRTIPNFKLIDENGAEYETTSYGWRLKDSIDTLDSLNPGVSKQGTIAFDVPQNHKYKLKVSGGFWSSENVFINLFSEKIDQKIGQERDKFLEKYPNG